MDKLFTLTSEFIRGIESHPKVLAADLSKGTIGEALKYNLINLEGAFHEFNEILANKSIFLNVYAMLCRAAQESTATVLYLTSKPDTKHKKFCKDVIYNSDLLHYVYHVLEDEKDEEYALSALRGDVWSWTGSGYGDRIKSSLGLGELAFYQYASALAHYSMLNDYYIDKHPEDFRRLRNMFLFKICKYIYLTVCKMIELKIITNPVVLLILRSYASKAEIVMKKLNNPELNEILALKMFQSHTHEQSPK